MRRLLLQNSWNIHVDCHFREAIFERDKNENVNIRRSLEADRIEQVRIFMLFSRTEAIESVTFA